MRTHCTRCGAFLAADGERCITCGNGSADEVERDTASPDSIYLMLVMANVLRLRRQYDLAEAQCSKVLRREPRHAAAHSILGDIARDRGNLRDAVEWYKMALDLDPANSSDRRKLEETIDRLYSPDRPGAIEKLRLDVKDQLDSAAAEMQAARLPSAVSIALGAMLIVILMVTILVLALGRGGAPTPPPATAQSASGGFVAQAPPDPVAAPAIDVEGESDDPQMPRFSEDVGPLEAALTEALAGQARATDPNGEVQQAEIDPRDGKVSVRFSLPRVWSAQQTRDSITRLAERLALAAVEWDGRVSAVRVRCDVRQRDRPDKVAFIGEAMAVSLSAPAQGLPADPSGSLFHSVWWDPELEWSVDQSPAPGAR